MANPRTVSKTSKTNQTPQRTTRQSPRRPRKSDQRNASERSSESEYEDRSDNDASNSESHTQSQNQSHNGSNHDDSIDFLGQPPTPPTSGADTSYRSSQDFQGTAPSETSSQSRTNDSPQSTPEISTRQTTKQRPSKTPTSSRKQAKPKKRKDKVTKELVHFQKTTKLLIPRLPFQRLVREVMLLYKNDFRLQTAALECLQEASESYITQLFEDSYLCCLHRSRITLTEKDIRLVQILRGPTDAGRR